MFFPALCVVAFARPAAVPQAAANQQTRPPAAQAPAPAVPEPDAAYYFLLGRFFESTGKTSDAADALKKAIALAPEDAEPRAELAELYARQDDAADSVAASEDALRVDPKNADANRVLGLVLAALADQKQPLKPGDDVSTYSKRAMAALEIARAADPDDLNLDLTLGRLYIDNDRPGDGVPLLQRVVDQQPDYTEGGLLLAEAQEASGREAAAASTLQGVLENNPKSLRAAVQLAGLFDREENYSAAADAWGRAQTLNPGNTEIATRRAAALVNAGRSQDAVGVLKDALKQQPSDLQISLMLGRAEREAGDLDEAETTARTLRTAHPDDERTTELLAQVLEARGRYQDEIDLLKPEIARLHGQASAAAQTAQLLAAEGLAFQQLHKYDEAIAAFKDGVALAPIDPVRYMLLIQGYADAGRYKEALDEADVALQKFPQNAGIQYQQGAAFDRAGRPADAERVFRDLIARDPLDGEALNYLGYMLAEHDTSLDEAVSFIQRALKVEPGNPSYLDSLGFAYVKEGKVDLADEPLTTAADKMPTNSAIQDHLGDLRLKQNRRADAIAAWQRALAGDGEEIDRGKIEKKIAAAKKEK